MYYNSSMNFKKATLSNLDQINTLIQRSKSHWDYEKSYLEQALKVICLDNDYLEANDCFEVYTDQLVAFISIINKQDYIVLDNLWVDPDHLNKSIGSSSLQYIFDLYKNFKIVVYPEPSSEGFYIKYGFKDTGKVKPSRVQGGPLFKEFIIQA
jgi:N-acetylglutamate synthase-like GNAT family acetyltransferase